MAGTLGQPRLKHGMCGTPEHRAWRDARQRCMNPSHADFKDYGARGIVVCERWESFATFYADMGPRPSGHSLERKNNDEGYEPGNCVWATRTQQACNQRAKKASRTGVRGVTPHKNGGFVASIRRNGTRLFRCFKDFDAAKAQRQQWENENAPS